MINKSAPQLCEKENSLAGNISESQNNAPEENEVLPMNPSETRHQPSNESHISSYERSVSKVIIEYGVKGKRTRPCSVCRFSVQDITRVNTSLKKEFESSTVFGPDPGEIGARELSLSIGSSDNVLDRALELALLSMDQGERSNICLFIPQTIKEKDMACAMVECLHCTVNLIESTLVDGLLSFLKDDEVKYLLALEQKEKAVELFKSKRFTDAFHRFSDAAKIIMTMNCVLLETEERNLDVDHLLSTLFSNLAQCHLCHENLTHALTLSSKALKLNPNNVKAMYRKAQAAWCLNNVEQADSVLKELLALEPSNSAAKHLHGKIKLRISKYDAEYSQMMKKIFQKD